jgi:polysaccharide export outer membrane protein
MQCLHWTRVVIGAAVNRFAVVSIALLIACTPSRPTASLNLPPPVPSTSVGPGDLFALSIVGEKELPTDYRVQPDGSVDLPYVGRLLVGGLEPQQIVDVYRKKLEEAKILTNPSVSLVVKEYNSKRIAVIGQITKPGQIPYTEGMKLVDALTAAGWFTPLADSNHVVLTRNLSPTKTVTVVVSVDAITDGQQADLPLQAGDTIKVDARVF